MSYLGETGQITQRQRKGPAGVTTAWSYLPNSGDRRLAAITNTIAKQARQFLYTTTPEDLITAITEKDQSGNVLESWNYAYDNANRLTGAVSSLTGTYSYTLDPAGNITAVGNATLSYNNLNELTSASNAPGCCTYDADGDLVSDGAHTYSWDAANRLVGMTGAGVQISFTYDGLDHRFATTETSGSTTTTTYEMWCGARVCQQRNADGSILRELFAEGFVDPSALQQGYYGPDQLGTPRFDQVASSIYELDYDPLGNQTAGPANVLPIGYAGMLFDSASGLNTTQYRSYDPGIGRWLSRDPLGEASDPAANLYRYVGGNPIGFTDASGLQYIPPAAMQHILAGHGCNTQRTRPGNSVFSPEYSNPAALQQLSNDVFAAPGGPPQPYYGRLESIQGQVNLQNQETGETVPYPIGTAGNGMSTNAVRIIYDPATGNVETMYPIPPQ
jgi:RHS repeat-associated protein